MVSLVLLKVHRQSRLDDAHLVRCGRECGIAPRDWTTTARDAKTIVIITNMCLKIEEQVILPEIEQLFKLFGLVMLVFEIPFN